MSNVLTLPMAPPISLRVGRALLERMQANVGMPYHAPTVMLRRRERGNYVDYEPENVLAVDLCRFAGQHALQERHVQQLRDMGFAVEFCEGGPYPFPDAYRRRDLPGPRHIDDTV